MRALLVIRQHQERSEQGQQGQQKLELVLRMPELVRLEQAQAPELELEQQVLVQLEQVLLALEW